MPRKQKSKSIVPTGGVPASIQELHIQNVVDAVQNATPYEWLSGYFWYPIYSAMIAEYSHWPKRIAVALFAVLSPQRKVTINWRIFEDAHNIDPWLLGTIFNERHKVAGILGTGEVESYLSGDKVEAFFANLMGDGNRVTVDRHAISLALGQHITGGVASPIYQYTELVYQMAAARLGLAPNVVQAIAWVHHRNNKGIKDKGSQYIVPLNSVLAYVLYRMNLASKTQVYGDERMAA